jgi:hypothetical protein
MYTSLLLLLAGSGSDSALDANTTERIGPSSRVLPRCNVHVFEPVHKTSTKSRQGGSTESQYDVFSRIAPRVNSTPRSSADWILFGSDLTFRDAHRHPAIRELIELAANSTVPIVASSFFIHTRVPHLPRHSREQAGWPRAPHRLGKQAHRPLRRPRPSAVDLNHAYN